MMGLARYVARIGEMKISYKILVGNSEGGRLHGRSRRKRKGIIKIYFKEIVPSCLQQFVYHLDIQNTLLCIFNKQSDFHETWDETHVTGG
jgi:hypothetical protein